MEKSGRLGARKWCGDIQEVSMTSGMLDNLRSVYLKPLRDAEQGLKPSRTSQLSRLVHLLSDEAGQSGIAVALKELDDKLKAHQPIVDTPEAITTRHKPVLCDTLPHLFH